MLQRKENKCHDYQETKLAYKWKDIHGKNDWKGMIHSIDPLLRAELIRYKDMLQACYNAYDLDRICKIDPSFFFKITSRENHGYDLSSYIYSKCLTHSIWPSDWSHEAIWIGYVAVSNDEYSTHLGRRDITIVRRKTMKDVEEIADLIDFQKPARDYNMPSRDPTIKTEAGLLNIYMRKHDQCNVCKLSARVEGLGVKILRVVNKHDLEVQIRLIQKLGEFFWSYWYIGEEIILDHKISPSLKDMNNLTYINDLEVHLHLLNWFQGKGKGLGFSLHNRRDIYLERKITDLIIKTHIEMAKGEKKYRKFDGNLKRQYVQQLHLKNQSSVEDEHQ